MTVPLPRLLGAVTTLLVAAAAAPLLVAAPAQAAPAPTASSATPATFGIGPSDGTGIDKRAQLNVLASPGATLTDHVAVVNIAAKPVTLRVYTADATSSADGSIGYQPKAARHADASAWITAATPHDRGVVTLRARGRAVLPVTVRVPADATPGDHVAGVIASLTSKVRNPKGQLIDFEQRVALRTTVRVSGTITPKLAVEDLHADYSGVANPVGAGSATVTYTVRNTGNVALAAGQDVSVSGLFGSTDAPSVAAVPMLLPKASVRMSVTVADVLPAVHLTARVTLHPRGADGDTGAQPATSTSTGFLAIPWALVVVVVVLVAAAFALRAWRRRPSALASGRHRTRPALS